MRIVTKRKLIRNALRGAAHPWTFETCRETFTSDLHHREKLELFNKHIGNIFPLILDSVANGVPLTRIEKQMGLTHRMLWQWLSNKRQLMEMVKEARRLRVGSRVLSDEFDPP